MMDEYCKCNFCKKYDTYDGCQDWFCSSHDSYEPSRQRIVEKAQCSGISVADVIALINLEG